MGKQWGTDQGRFLEVAHRVYLSLRTAKINYCALRLDSSQKIALIGLNLSQKCRNRPAIRKGTEEWSEEAGSGVESYGVTRSEVGDTFNVKHP